MYRCLCVALLLLLATARAQEPVLGEYDLSAFGPVATAAEAQATLTTAIDKIVAAGGGRLVVAPGVAADWRLTENPAPSSTRHGAATVTIIDRRRGYETVLLPSNAAHTGTTGWLAQRFSRAVRQPIDMAYGVHSSVGITTDICGGTSSYLQRIVEDVEPGDNVRVYVPTIRGLAVGNMIVVYNPNEFVPIKQLGWDKEKQLPYIVVDLKHPHAKTPSIYQFGIGDKHVVNSLTITDNAQSDNQSMSVKVGRNVYADGDGFVYLALIRNQANIMSSLGDEGASCYQADVCNDLQPFRSTVESIDWERRELVYAPGMTRNFTLGTSRPLIDMNPEKHVTAGTVLIVAPGHRDPWDPNDTDETGAGHEGTIFPGGAIIGSAECGWTPEVVGRFFAVDEPEEYLDPANDPAAGYTAAPDMRVYRWYQVRQLENRPDGTFRLHVERTRWVCSTGAVPKLWNRDSYTDTLGSTPRLQPLHYIIAPGAYVADVSRAWTDSRASGGRVDQASPRTLVLAPSSDMGTAFDFAPGDPIVQAIGQDPWNPTGFRVRHHNYLPSTIEDCSFSSVNNGRVPVYAALSVHGGGTSLDPAGNRRKGGGAAYARGVDIAATTAVGIRFAADVGEAAICFDQPHGRAQPMWWRGARGRVVGNLTVDPEGGGFSFRGGRAVEVPGITIRGSGGLSATTTPANNLRGIDIRVAEATTRVEVTFPVAEADGAYAVHVQPSWFAMDRVTAKTAKGFVVEFSAGAPAGGTFDWQICR